MSFCPGCSTSADYRERLLNLESAPAIPSLSTANYEKMVLKPGLRAVFAQRERLTQVGLETLSQ